MTTTTPNLDTSASAAGMTVRFYATPHLPTASPRAALIALINGAKHTIDFGIYAFTSTQIADALIAAKTRGVKIRGIADGSQGLTAKNQVERLRTAGIDIRYWGAFERVFHDKLLMVDGGYRRLGRLAIGSYNWTGGAENNNNEVMAVIAGTQLANILRHSVMAQLDQAYTEGRTTP